MTKCIFLLFSIVSVGCNSQIASYVAGAAKPIPVPIATSNASPYAIKISPGHVLATGSVVSSNANITSTNRTLKGSQIQASVSISQSRKN